MSHTLLGTMSGALTKVKPLLLLKRGIPHTSKPLALPAPLISGFSGVLCKTRWSEWLITSTSTHAGTAEQAGSVTFRLHAAAWGAVESRTPSRALLLASWILLATP